MMPAEHFDCVAHLAVTAGFVTQVGLGYPRLAGSLTPGKAEPKVPLALAANSHEAATM